MGIVAGNQSRGLLLHFKCILKNKIYYFNIFSNKNHIFKHPILFYSWNNNNKKELVWVTLEGA